MKTLELYVTNDHGHRTRIFKEITGFNDLVKVISEAWAHYTSEPGYQLLLSVGEFDGPTEMEIMKAIKVTFDLDFVQARDVLKGRATVFFRDRALAGLLRSRLARVPHGTIGAYEGACALPATYKEGLSYVAYHKIEYAPTAPATV